MRQWPGPQVKQASGSASRQVIHRWRDTSLGWGKDTPHSALLSALSALLSRGLPGDELSAQDLSRTLPPPPLGPPPPPSTKSQPLPSPTALLQLPSPFQASSPPRPLAFLFHLSGRFSPQTFLCLTLSSWIPAQSHQRSLLEPPSLPWA